MNNTEQKREINIEQELKNAFEAGEALADAYETGSFPITFDIWLLTNSGAINSYESMKTRIQELEEALEGMRAFSEEVLSHGDYANNDRDVFGFNGIPITSKMLRKILFAIKGC